MSLSIKKPWGGFQSFPGRTLYGRAPSVGEAGHSTDSPRNSAAQSDDRGENIVPHYRVPPPYRRKAGGNYLNATVDFLGIIYAIIRHPKQISKQTKSKMSHCNVIT